MRSVTVTLLLALLSCSTCQAEEGVTLTKKLVDQFHVAWNANDLESMVDLLSPTSFFKTPFQLRYWRETMARTVLITNPPAFRNVRTVERYSHIGNDIAWSIGDMLSDVYEDGVHTDEDFPAEYTYIFTKSDSGAWKLEVMVFHE